MIQKSSPQKQHTKNLLLNIRYRFEFYNFTFFNMVNITYPDGHSPCGY
jgi:hypothetical protein